MGCNTSICQLLTVYTQHSNPGEDLCGECSSAANVTTVAVKGEGAESGIIILTVIWSDGHALEMCSGVVQSCKYIKTLKVKYLKKSNFSGI